jgi:4-cresol dehydrogenase (hydroxylating)
MRTPPGVSEADFTEALRQFEAVVGAQWVFSRDEDVATYKDAYSPFWNEPEDKWVSAAVAPTTVEELQKILAIANRYSIPLYTVSTGRNLAYGGSAPVYSGSVVLDLKRMNRILEVNEENAFALVEPGVSYFDLYRYIRERGLKLWIDCPDPGWGSLVGNALDHGAGRTPLPYRDHFDAHCGLEVVLANGEVVRTGMGALPSTKLWQQTKYGAGPLLDGMFSQSNFGIVTKMGFWLMPEPEASMTARISVPRHDDVIPFVRTLSSLMYSNSINCLFSVLSPIFLAPLNAETSALFAKQDGGTPEEWDRYASTKGLPFWQTELRFYGTPKVMAAQWEHVKDRMSGISGVKFEDGETTRFPLTDEQIRNLTQPGDFGIPSLSVFSGVALATNPVKAPVIGHLDASVILPLDGASLLQAHRVFAQFFRETGLEHSLGFAMAYHWRTFIMFHGMHISADRELNAKVRAAYEHLIDLAASHGWGFYRTHIGFMDKVMNTYSFNDHSLLKLHATLKDAVDPKGILSPGRYAIWPKGLRGSKA